MNLRQLQIGQSARILSVGGEGALRQHFLDMGVIPTAEVTLVKYAPLGDPMELRIHGYELTLRLADAEKITVEPIEKLSAEIEDRKENILHMHHPGLGEGGKYHDKKTENPLPDDSTLTFALVGNQNCGKTTLFNQLTGSNQHVGNFPGVTVDRKDGKIRDHDNTNLTDLPGIYSLSPYTDEEIVSREFILGEKPAGIINILDATNIERNLYLTLQLMELEVPMVIALNMMDEVRGNGGTIHINDIEDALGVPVVPISASKNEGVDELVSHALHVAKYQEKPEVTDFCDENGRGGAVHRCIHAVMSLIEDHAAAASLPVRFAATKLIEGDPIVTEQLKLTQNEKDMVEHIVVQMEEEGGLDRAAAIADMRFAYIKKVCRGSVVRPRESKEHIRSEKIDKLLTGKWTAIPCFILIMLLVFWLSFDVIGANLQALLSSGISLLSDKTDILLTNLGVSHAVYSLVIDAIFAGVGSVVSFVPIIATLFLFLSILEDSGYMARVAFFMDSLLRKIGLSGRSIVPMIIGFGCSVPSIMATRTLPSERDRKMTMLLIPFMSCSAKIPVYGLIVDIFFKQYKALIMVGLYVFSIAMGIIVAALARKTVFKGEAVPFVMELPNYRMPSLRNTAMLLWDKVKDFLERAFTVIFVATLVVWFLQNFDFSFNMVSDASESILAVIAGFIAPIFKPFGFGGWRQTAALISGFMAKEGIVATLNVLFPTAELLRAAFSERAAISFLVFTLLYTPCVAAVSASKKEFGRGWAAFMIVFQFAVAWIAAFVIHMIHI